MEIHDLKNKNVIITGGLGFIGSNLAIKLVGLGANVTLIDNMINNSGGNIYNIKDINKYVKVNISDIRDDISMRYLIKGQDYLFNLAGLSGHMFSLKNPIIDLEINCRAQLTILEICKNNNPDIIVVYASTRQIYGRPDYLPVDEKHLVNPVDVNGINKAAGERYHSLYNNLYGIRTTILRLTNIYGPRMRIKDALQNFVGLWICKILQDKTIEVWGGKQIRDLCYIDDVVDALVMVALDEKAYGKIFNIGGIENVNLKVLAETLINIYGSGEYILNDFPTDRKKIDIGDYWSDWNVINKLLGWKPQITLNEGLERTIKYYKDNLDYYI